MTRSLLLTGFRDLVRRPLHTGLMVLGVALAPDGSLGKARYLIRRNLIAIRQEL